MGERMEERDFLEIWENTSALEKDYEEACVNSLKGKGEKKRDTCLASASSCNSQYQKKTSDSRGRLPRF